MNKAGVREDHRTGQYVPTVNGVDVSPTSFDKQRALEIARQAANKTEHTPGPWFLNAGSTNGKVDDQVYSQRDNRTVIANIVHRDGLSAREINANAHLIASAPELLEACKLWERAEKDGGVSMADLRNIASNAIRAAIAKAEGRTE